MGGRKTCPPAGEGFTNPLVDAQSRDSLKSSVLRVGDLRGRLPGVYYVARSALYRVVLRTFQSWHRWRTAFRSFRGHIQTLRTIKYQSLDLGPALQLLADGQRLACTRTVARSYGTQLLETKYPWVDLVDLRVFLLGFDEGEKWGLGNPCSTCTRLADSCDSFTRQLTTPPASKCDSSTPPPSQESP